MSFCVLDAQCTVYDRQAKVPGLAYTGALCPGCHSRASVELNLLRYDYVDLSQNLPLKDARGEVRIFRPKPESKPPMDLEVFSLRSEIVRAVVRAADAVAHAHLHVVGVREGFALDAAAGLLRFRLDDLAQQKDVQGWWDPRSPVCVALSGPEILALFSALHRRARRLVGLDSPILRLPGECPACSVPALRRRADADDWIWCASCGGQLTRERYTQLLQLRIGA